jgi:glyceraldehyde 3-phosphate dehydrogenase
MSAATIGLMGFGRIGRNIFRILFKSEDVRIEAISDIADPAALVYLLRFDTLLGRFPEDAAVREGRLVAGGRAIPMLSGEKPGDVPWGELGVDTVIEATARYRTRDEIEKHLAAGARRVILCVPPLDPPDITIVRGVNESALRREHRIVSNASCTAQSAAPVLKVLQESFGIRRAFFTSVHAYTSEQRLADVPSDDKRRGRSAPENIIPQATRTADLIAEILPQLAGRLTGAAMNVPVRNGSVVDLVCWHERKVTAAAINGALREAAGRMPAILRYETEPIVSSDIVGSETSGVFDSLATLTLADDVSKTLTWYDNSWSYAHRAVDLVRQLARLDAEAA